MITLSNLEKYFNKNRSNEIHVINDITLELPSKGLVVLLGPSGSGKTTLLNVIGGLDKLQSGHIDFDGQIIEKYKSNKWDRIRNEHIGYVFQNYNLLHDQTVYDNIALSLRMAGIYDKEEIDTRINYILDNVGMINYRRRKAANLSGGQQQRVAIARALAKNPKVIIADEPTGNLDSKNTFDIMNILKQISASKLVVLVTHEESIAKMYADRVIRLRDGQIVEDTMHQSTGGIDVQLETDIYLKDLRQVTHTKEQNNIFSVYTDEENNVPFDVKLIVKNKTLYVQIENEEYTRVNLLNKDSEVQVFDAHYQEQQMAEFSETDFDLEGIIDDSVKQEKRSVISNKEAIKMAFSKFRQISKGSAFLYIIFFFIAATIGIALGLVFNAYHVEDADFLSKPKNIVTAQYDEFTYDDYLALDNDLDGASIQIITSISNQIQLPSIYQTSGQTLEFSAMPISPEYLSDDDILYGRNVQNQNEVVITKAQAEELSRQTLPQSLGITSPEDFLTLSIVYEVANGVENMEIEVAIVGITDLDDVGFYVMNETAWMMATGRAVYEVYQDQITIIEEADAAYDHPFYGKEDAFIYGLGDEVPSLPKFTSNYQATYTASDDVPAQLYTLEDIIENQVITKIDSHINLLSIDIYSLDPENTMEQVQEDAQVVTYTYPNLRAAYLGDKLLNSVPYLLFAGLFLAASAIGTFFILRSSLLARIYEISVYRALGATKKDLRKIYLIEAFIVTFVTSLWGFLISNILLIRLQVMTSEFTDVIRVTPFSFALGLIIVFGINIVSGVLPVSNLLRKTPAEIISKYDF
jgi:ABC-type lipoprotein export system ATPase subunit/ABC-type antimicrobial peptide transport system permease subunit